MSIVCPEAPGRTVVGAALLYPEAEGTGLIPTRVLSDELAAEQGGDGMPVDASAIRDDDPSSDRETGQAPRD